MYTSLDIQKNTREDSLLVSLFLDTEQFVLDKPPIVFVKQLLSSPLRFDTLGLEGFECWPCSSLPLLLQGSEIIIKANLCACQLASGLEHSTFVLLTAELHQHNTRRSTLP